MKISSLGESRVLHIPTSAFERLPRHPPDLAADGHRGREVPAGLPGGRERAEGGRGRPGGAYDPKSGIGG